MVTADLAAGTICVMSIRLPADMHERLRQIAFDRRTSMNALIIEAVRKDPDLR